MHYTVESDLDVGQMRKQDSSERGGGVKSKTKEDYGQEPAPFYP